MTPGQRAYEKWREIHSQPKLRHTEDVEFVPWEKLSKYVKSVWEAVAKAAIGG